MAVSCAIESSTLNPFSPTFSLIFNRRNVLAGVFPLFAPAMYHNLEPAIASTILGAVAAVLGICPFILFFYGATIRSKSKVAKALAEKEQATKERMDLEREKNERRKKRQEREKE